MLTRRTALGALAGSALLPALPGLAHPAFAQAKQKQIAVVVKIGGIPWFNSMEAGIKERAQELGVDLTEIEGTGSDGRITVDDVKNYAESMEAEEEPKASDAARRKAEELGVPVLDEAAFERLLATGELP